MRHIVIVGGGYTGVCLAVQLVQQSPVPLAITLVEPREHLGQGQAYSTRDPDHRLNAPTYVHSAVPQDAWHFTRWCVAQGLMGPDSPDPAALRPDGAHYMRRAEFGRYLQETLQAHAQGASNGCRITHHRGEAVAAQRNGSGWQVQTRAVFGAGAVLTADMLLLATGNPRMRLPPVFAPALTSHPGVIENALDAARLQAVNPQARVLLLGGGLTSLDALASLLRQGHQGPIVVISRRGLRPRPQGPVLPVVAQLQIPEVLASLPGRILLDRLANPVPEFLKQAGHPPNVRALLRALRLRVAQVQAEGLSWTTAFDELRDSLWQLWPQLPTAEKQRFLKRLRIWYDVHRFRTVPHTDALVQQAQARGQLSFWAGRVQAVQPARVGQGLQVDLTRQGVGAPAQPAVFDAVINCTGLDTAAGMADNPLLADLLAQGLLRPDACALGLDVDSQCCAIDRTGQAQPDLRVLGPATLGTFGDPIGALYIGGHVHRVMPDVLRVLTSRPART